MCIKIKYKKYKTKFLHCRSKTYVDTVAIYLQYIATVCMHACGNSLYSRFKTVVHVVVEYKPM